jgi:hypothetical protein
LNELYVVFMTALLGRGIIQGLPCSSWNLSYSVESLGSITGILWPTAFNLTAPLLRRKFSSSTS